MKTWQSAKQEETSLKERMKELEKEKKELIARGEAAEQEVSKIKALLGNPHDIVKAVQKLVEENANFRVKHEKLTVEMTDTTVTTTIESNE